jgi:hypothetical protein
MVPPRPVVRRSSPGARGGAADGSLIAWQGAIRALAALLLMASPAAAGLKDHTDRLVGTVPDYPIRLVAPAYAEYARVLEREFNYLIAQTYWRSVHPQPDVWVLSGRWPAPDEHIGFAEARGIRVRATHSFGITHAAFRPM